MLKALLIFITLVLVMTSFLLLLGLLHICNSKKKSRYRQVLVPIAALIAGISVVTDMDLLGTLFEAILGVVERIAPMQEAISSSSWLSFFVCNCLYVIVFCVVKLICIYGLVLVGIRWPRPCNKLYGLLYEYDESDDLWLLKDSYLGVRHMARVVFYATTFLACALVIPSFLGLEGFRNTFYPSVGMVFTAELYYFLCGESRAEHNQSIEEDADAAVRMYTYGKIVLTLKHKLGSHLLHETSYTLKQLPNTTDFEFCKELKHSTSYEKQIAGHYYAELIRRGVMAGDGSGQYGGLERSAVLGSIRLMEGESVLVANPFYRDFTPYLFLVVQHVLLRNGNVVFLHGSSMDEKFMEEFVHTGVRFVSGIPDMWTTAPLKEDGSATPQIGTLSYARMGDVRLLLNNKAFFRDTALAVVIDAGSMLSSCPTSLDIFSLLVNAGSCCTFCAFSRNTDGLVDALSHALRTSIVEVTATEMSHGLTIGAFWDVAAPSVGQKLLPGVSRYLGIAPEIGMVGLRGQVEKASWVGRKSVPLLDQRWIMSQYYREIFDYVELPQDQEQIDRRFEFITDPFSTSRQSEQFLLVEDEFNNLFECYRQFSSRGMRESFVNVLSANYLLRDYMIDNALVFEHDPKAIPNFAPDYPRSARNAAVSLAMRMLDGGQFVSQEEISHILRYLGYSCAHVQSMLERLLDTYVLPCADCAELHAKDYLAVRIERCYSETMQTIVQRREYGLRETAHISSCFQSLKGVELITELPDGTTSKLATRMMGLVWQTVLPGQLITVEGKYYEVLRISSDSGVVLRRASDHFKERSAYRQLRSYELRRPSVDDTWERETSRLVRGVTVEHVVYDILVRTSGYLSLPSYNDIYHSRRVSLDEVPERRYAHKGSIRLVFPNFSQAAIRTLAVVMNEILVTLFPNEYEYVAVLITECDGLPEGMLHTMTVIGDESVGVSSGCAIYVVEDSPVDLGIVTSIERNIVRILEMCADYLAWVQESSTAAPDAGLEQDAEEITDEEPQE